jgi:hypothetical protein
MTCCLEEAAVVARTREEPGLLDVRLIEAGGRGACAEVEFTQEMMWSGLLAEDKDAGV